MSASCSEVPSVVEFYGVKSWKRISANVEKIKVNPNQYVLTIQLLVRNQRFAELGIFIIRFWNPQKKLHCNSWTRGVIIPKRGSWAKMDIMLKLYVMHGRTG